ncbi:MAG: hypothetical protein PF448_14220 [Bacteroidales bacterium]|jgi:hypothetical protein|nr:hypothetical protein [Bacteroidales bacterium]
MKTHIICLLILLSSTLCFSQATQNIYQIKSGYVKYELTGNAEGTKKLWWDDYGAKTRTETQSTSTTKIFGMTSETQTNKVEIKVGTSYWTVDLNKMTGQEGNTEGFVDYSAYDEMTEAEKEAYAEAMLDSLGGEKLPSEMFLGCKCDVILLWGSKIWSCKNVPLKSEISLMGINTYETATEFKKNIPVSSSKFEKPAGVEFTQQGNSFDMFDQYMDQKPEGEDYNED